MASKDSPMIDPFNAERRSRGSMAGAEALRNPDRVNHVATTERVYDADEHEFLKAVAEYRRKTGRRFPTFTEVRQILLDMGYAKKE